MKIIKIGINTEISGDYQIKYFKKERQLIRNAKTGQTQLAYDACKYDIHYQCTGISSTHIC